MSVFFEHLYDFYALKINLITYDYEYILFLINKKKREREKYKVGV